MKFTFKLCLCFCLAMLSSCGAEKQDSNKKSEKSKQIKEPTYVSMMVNKLSFEELDLTKEDENFKNAKKTSMAMSDGGHIYVGTENSGLWVKLSGSENFTLINNVGDRDDDIAGEVTNDKLNIFGLIALPDGVFAFVKGDNSGYAIIEYGNNVTNSTLSPDGVKFAGTGTLINHNDRLIMVAPYKFDVDGVIKERLSAIEIADGSSTKFKNSAGEEISFPSQPNSLVINSTLMSIYVDKNKSFAAKLSLETLPDAGSSLVYADPDELSNTKELKVEPKVTFAVGIGGKGFIGVKGGIGIIDETGKVLSYHHVADGFEVKASCYRKDDSVLFFSDKGLIEYDIKSKAFGPLINLEYAKNNIFYAREYARKKDIKSGFHAEKNLTVDNFTTGVYLNNKEVLLISFDNKIYKLSSEVVKVDKIAN